MTIWIEQILIDNFVINLFIFFTLNQLLQAKIKNLRMVMSSLLGSVVALILPLFRLYFWFNTLIKILLSIVMVLLLKKYQKFKEFMLYYITFLFITFLYGGLCLFLLISFDKNFSPSNYYSYSLPLWGITILIMFAFIVLKNIFKTFYKRKTLNNFIYKIIIYNNGKSDEMMAFLDSGNNLVDDITKKPITVVDFKALNKTLNGINLTDLILSKEKNFNKVFKDAHIFKTQSVGSNTNSIMCVTVEKMEIYSEGKVHIINDAIIGLTLKSFVSDINYSALLSPNLI